MAFGDEIAVENSKSDRQLGTRQGMLQRRDAPLAEEVDVDVPRSDRRGGLSASYLAAREERTSAREEEDVVFNPGVERLQKE